MIEINLIPDVKLELLKARRQRRNIISMSILVAIVAGGAVALLVFYVFVIQTVAMGFTDRSIKSEFSKLSEVEDLSKILTIQDQLGKVSSLEEQKTRSSRLFDMLETIIPSGDNTVSYSTLKLDTEQHVITIEAEAQNGYEALEVFKKTIAQTQFNYYTEDMRPQDKPKSVNIAESSITVADPSYGQNSANQRVLRFTISFKYAPELFSTQSKNGKIVGPEKQNATDSARGVPKSLFTTGAGKEQQ